MVKVAEDALEGTAAQPGSRGSRGLPPYSAVCEAQRPKARERPTPGDWGTGLELELVPLSTAVMEDLVVHVALEEEWEDLT